MYELLKNASTCPWNYWSPLPFKPCYFSCLSFKLSQEVFIYSYHILSFSWFLVNRLKDVKQQFWFLWCLTIFQLAERETNLLSAGRRWGASLTLSLLGTERLKFKSDIKYYMPGYRNSENNFFTIRTFSNICIWCLKKCVTAFLADALCKHQEQ